MLRASVIGLALLLIGCAESATAPAATQTLRPMPRATVTESVERRNGILPVETLGPTPTPLQHVIAEGDTLLSIGIRYGVELADLLVANPGVNPNILVIGESLTIPLAGAQGPVPTATPVPVVLSDVACYEARPQGLTCLLTASAPDDIALEGVVALVTLADHAGEPLRSEPAYAPINLIQSGQKLPLIANFKHAEPAFSFASAVAIRALSVSDIEARFSEVEMENVSSSIAPDGSSAIVTGVVEVPSEAPVGLRLVVLVLGESGDPVGLLTWEAPSEGVRHDFELSVFSLGPPIHQVEITAEAPILP